MGDSQDKQVVLEFIRRHTMAVVATTHPDGTPEAAVIDFPVRDSVELVLDTFEDTRKFANIGEVIPRWIRSSDYNSGEVKRFEIAC